MVRITDVCGCNMQAQCDLDALCRGSGRANLAQLAGGSCGDGGGRLQIVADPSVAEPERSTLQQMRWPVLSNTPALDDAGSGFCHVDAAADTAASVTEGVNQRQRTRKVSDSNPLPPMSHPTGAMSQMDEDAGRSAAGLA
jgi:hypothetical protein